MDYCTTCGHPTSVHSLYGRTRSECHGTDADPGVCDCRSWATDHEPDPERKTRPGPAMIAALEYVIQHPGCSQHAAAVAAGPNGSHKFGAATVQRCRRDGLIYDDGSRQWSYTLYITAAGWRALCRQALRDVTAPRPLSGDRHATAGDAPQHGQPSLRRAP